MVDVAHRQEPYALRCEWGLAGALAVSPGVDVAVVVDVLSFTTTLSVAADRAIAVVPCPWHDDRAAELAARHDAVLARPRGTASVSLSPGSVRRAAGLERLVLPSPNGSTIAAALADRVPTVVGACPRNRAAVGAWLRERRAVDSGLRVAVVPAGERWPADEHGHRSLRPAIEDLWGAGGVLAVLGTDDPDLASPEARVAAAAFTTVRDDLARELAACASGRELADAGYAEDVAVAAELDASDAVPVLFDGVFRAT